PGACPTTLRASCVSRRTWHATSPGARATSAWALRRSPCTTSGASPSGSSRSSPERCSLPAASHEYLGEGPSPDFSLMGRTFLTNTYLAGAHMPESWARDAVFYHIYPLGLCGAEPRNDGTSPPTPRLDQLRDWIG